MRRARRARRLFAALGLACASLLAACASAPTAGTGDVAFRLLWEGRSDLDLHVQDPTGERIFFGERRVESGGVLDVDCNGASDRLCRHPIENVFWPEGRAPEGLYRFWVRAHYVDPSESPVAFQLQVLRGEEVVSWRRGTLAANGDTTATHTYEFRRSALR